jgi:SAM-dependent methyltransferase
VLRQADREDGQVARRQVARVFVQCMRHASAPGKDLRAARLRPVDDWPQALDDRGLLNRQQSGDVISGMPEMPTLARAVVTSPPYRVFARRVLVPWMLAGDQPAGEGLEIGAGSGVMSAQLLANVPTLRMVATDYDPHMVHAARRTLRSFGNRADVLQADAADLPFAGGRFDLVMSAAMLHHVPAWQDAVEHAIRVLRPGGRLIGYDLLESAPGRLVHVTERHTTKMLQPGELDAQLNRLAVSNVQVIPALRGTVVRFSATKTN